METTDWQALLILDACRADYFIDCYPDPEAIGLPIPPKSEIKTVLSQGRDTLSWMLKAFPVVAKKHPAVYTANPQTTVQINARYPTTPVINIWEKAWCRLTSKNIPSVHPWAVTGYVLGSDWYMMCARKIVVVYIQPHFPAIGHTPLAMGQWQTTSNDYSRACRHELVRPEKAYKRGTITLKSLRRAYADNVREVMRAALHLACHIKGKVVITSDHGESLGEIDEKLNAPMFGHSDRWTRMDHVLRPVPWLEVDCSVLDEANVNGTRDEITKQRLKDLGYM